jgi:hypothetical protein
MGRFNHALDGLSHLSGREVVDHMARSIHDL